MTNKKYKMDIIMWINNKEFEIKRFSSGEMKLKEAELLSLSEENQVEIVFNNEISLFELQILINYFNLKDIKVNLVLGYLPYQRMDKNNGIEVTTIDMVAEIFNNLHLQNLYVCEPHCNLTRFRNAKKINLVEKIFDRIKNIIHYNPESDYLVFTDKGSVEKYGKLSQNSIYFEKIRAKDTGLISSHRIIGDVNSLKKAIIVDDIISSGDTIVSCLELLPQDIDIYIISGHFEDNIYNQRIFEDKRVKTIFSSNSLTKIERPKLKLFDIKDLIK